MKGNQDDDIARILRNAITPVGNRETVGDLWPGMQKRMPHHGVSVSIFDWALAALALVLTALSPEAIFGLLAHL